MRVTAGRGRVSLLGSQEVENVGFNQTVSTGRNWGLFRSGDGSKGQRGRERRHREQDQRLL